MPYNIKKFINVYFFTKKQNLKNFFEELKTFYLHTLFVLAVAR